MEIAVVGLGYVGLPLAVSLSKHFRIIGFDISKSRISELKKGIDCNNETQKKDLDKAGKNLIFTNRIEEAGKSQAIIIAVPTPIKKNKTPDLSLVAEASRMVGTYLQKGTIVVYESTVYPGCTEEFCLPILEKNSGLKLGDFFIGYSPERINPGDKFHTINTVYKVVSGCDKDTTDKLAYIYGKITKTHKASSIKVAEAAKIIENVQRDLNIALVNELSLIFQKMGINTKEVIEAAGTKWNFHKYQPGLVGGHCIGVDPYYLTYKALKIGYHPHVILAGRQINDTMPSIVSKMIFKSLKKNKIALRGARALICGATFKENVKDLRNSKAEEVIEIFKKKQISITIFDPMFEHGERIFGFKNDLNPKSKYDILFFGAFHDQFKQLKAPDLKRLLNDQAVVFDMKSNLNTNLTKNNFTLLTL